MDVQEPHPPSFGAALQRYTYAGKSNDIIKRIPKSPSTRPLRKHISNVAKDTTTTPSATNTTSPRKRKAPTNPPLLALSPTKRKRPSTGYAPPTTYAHITNHLLDSLAPSLITIFIGVNPGIRTATTGHAYAHPSNLFWKLCHRSNCTPRLCSPSEDRELPHLYALGHTNIVARPTRDASELSKSEMDEGVKVLEEKVRKWRPESVCVVGKSIWESIWRVRHGRAVGKGEFAYGWQGVGENMGVERGGQGEGWGGARVFVATTTSGLAAGMRLEEKERIWRELGVWVERRRWERGIPDEGMGVGVREGEGEGRVDEMIEGGGGGDESFG